MDSSLLDRNGKSRWIRTMTNEELTSVMSLLGLEQSDDGWLAAPSERSMALHIAHDGVGHAVTRISAMKVSGGLIEAKTRKDERYVVLCSDVFAMAIDSSTAASRQAGFAADR